MKYHGVCGARQQVWDWPRSYTKPGTVYNPVKPLRGCPICELPDLSHILQQLLWYYKECGRIFASIVDAVQLALSWSMCQGHISSIVLHGVFVGEWLFVFPLCGFSLSLFCNYLSAC